MERPDQGGCGYFFRAAGFADLFGIAREAGFGRALERLVFDAALVTIRFFGAALATTRFFGAAFAAVARFGAAFTAFGAAFAAFGATFALLGAAFVLAVAPDFVVRVAGRRTTIFDALATALTATFF